MLKRLSGESPQVVLEEENGPEKAARLNQSETNRTSGDGAHLPHYRDFRGTKKNCQCAKSTLILVWNERYKEIGEPAAVIPELEYIVLLCKSLAL